MNPNAAPSGNPPTVCGDCKGEGQALIAQVIGRGVRRRTVEQYAACLTCSGTGRTTSGGEIR